MPLHKWTIRRSAREIYLDLKETEWLSKQALEELQLHKLQRLLQHAYVHVPFYRDAMRAAGVHPLEMDSLDDIRRLPLLSKDDVRRNLYFKLFADNHRKREMLKISTSGSTGEPFTTYADRYQLEVRFATTLRGSEWTGWRFGDRQARLWHQTLGMTRLQIIRERRRRAVHAPALHPRVRDRRREHRAVHRRDPQAPPGARRRLRGVAQLPRDLRARRRESRVLAEGDHLLRAGPSRQRPRR